MEKKIKKALISVFTKDGLENIAAILIENNVELFSTGGTFDFLVTNNFPCKKVEEITSYPSILGGRVKTLHPKIFGGILGRQNNEQDIKELIEFEIPTFDMVIVDLYPFEETVAQTNDEKLIIEKIDIGGPSMIRAAAKNHQDCLVVSNPNQYQSVVILLSQQKACTTIEQRRVYAIKAFDVCSHYDNAISNYFNKSNNVTPFNKTEKVLRYGENPHQAANYFGDLNEIFEQQHGKELSYNNLVDVDAALQIMQDINLYKPNKASCAIIKHTNVCGLSVANDCFTAWENALSGDPESAFGGIIIFNAAVTKKTAEAIQSIFFEVLLAPSFDDDAIPILKEKKNRILLSIKKYPISQTQQKNLLNGILVQQTDDILDNVWEEKGGRVTTNEEKENLVLANIAAKHLKSNSIALVNNNTLIGKGCGQTSRIDSLKQALEKANQFKQDLNNAVLASDAFFPFDDCIKMIFANGIKAVIQPGGSVRDEDTLKFAVENNMVMVITNARHFKH